MDELWSAIKEQVVPLLAYAVCAGLLGLLFTWLCVKLLPKVGLMDKPGGHHIHTISVPRGGGIAIYLAFMLTMAVYFSYVRFLTGMWLFTYSYEVVVIILGGSLIFLLGLLDDIWNLKAIIKLTGQIFIAVLSWRFGIRFEHVFSFNMPDWLSLTLTVVWICAFINGFNLIDGIDGLASGLGVVAGLCLAVWFAVLGIMDFALLLLVVCGACLGFLRFNFSPARIFLGDSGSMFIGYVIGAVGLCSVSKAATFTAVIIPVLAAGIPIFDEFLAVWRRGARYLLNKVRGLKPDSRIMSADKEHIHHRLLKRRGHHSQAALILYVAGFCCAMLAIVLMFVHNRNSWLAFVIVGLLVWFAMKKIGSVELWSSAQMLEQSFKRPHRGLFFTLILPFCDTFCLMAAYIIAFMLAAPMVSFGLGVFLFIVAFMLTAMIVCGIYRIYWARACFGDFGRLLLVLCGGLTTAGLLAHYFISSYSIVLSQYLIFALLGICFLFFGRSMFLFVAGEMVRKAYVHYIKSDGTSPRRAVLYGGGLNARLFRDYNTMKVRETNLEVIGIIDDDVSIRNMKVLGLKVFGKSLRISRIYSKNRFEVLVVTSANIPEKRLSPVREFCKVHNIEYKVFHINLEGQ